MATLAITDGKLWDYNSATTTWTNAAALEQLNADLGTSLTANNICGLKYEASGSGGATSSVTLNFAQNAGVGVGSDMTFYVVVAASGQDSTAAYTNFSVSGLADSNWEWEAAGGDGFSSDAMNVPNNNLTMIKVTGALTDARSVTFSSNVAKNGWAMVSYTPNAPEPATAALSLLALAGLSLRRRRK